MKNIENKSLQDLLGKWKGEVPKRDSSSSIQIRTYNLYSKKIKDFDIDDLRFMLGQEVGSKYILPIAMKYLKENILIEANYYEGDLLSSILLLPKSFWKKNIKFYSEVYSLLLSNRDSLSNLDMSFDVDRDLVKQYENFLQILESR
ncbi:MULTISPECIES: contact-dependent growth inhibition system immunity protein [unclassified Tenacibaculum]|uniref:contact-dependent growth inhibition system immunity protein n=1 Tax=unclassified Tenacibaculum TaxID=2635139 RepID=UPI001F16697B|nr:MULTISPECIES: contact-dependent growth inhibition system immunity protein [unclassified Tenacibaculum]MCF2876118.1 hypothetical protein [Tenacibaculum sp. Cn5-1]MCF2936193.1 hypothetical protein [Tenacibaculum sp. Cn5-34]MCG7512754.1 contact-dependent growth inhibition system immunity protein [Tenacibaculum sp. Cn5-46]